MRILMINHNVAWSGGTFFRAYHFAHQMAQRNHQVTMLTISPNKRFGFQRDIRHGFEILETPDWLWGRGRTGWDLWDTLRRIQYSYGQDWDLVHAFDSRPAVILPALALQRRGVPLILDWADWWGHGGTIQERPTGFVVKQFISPVETYFEEAFRTQAQGTTVISLALRDRAIGLGVPPKTIAQIPQGSDIESIKPQDQKTFRRVLGIPEQTPIIGYLGVLNKNDADLLFTAFTHLIQLRPNCQLVMIGRHKATVPKLANIHQSGFVPPDQLPIYLGACDLLVLPLKNTIASRGRWPSKINDYLAAGRPIVACAVGDIRKLFEQHLIGKATTDKPVPFAEAIATLLDDLPLRDEMGLNARRVAEEELAWPIIGNQVEFHYMKILRQ